jgi:hypothetical protein
MATKLQRIGSGVINSRVALFPLSLTDPWLARVLIARPRLSSLGTRPLARISLKRLQMTSYLPLAASVAPE